MDKCEKRLGVYCEQMSELKTVQRLFNKGFQFISISIFIFRIFAQ